MATIFETTTCGRCGGSGKYSFNLMHGDTCYGCGGSGIVLTKRGRAASARMHELQTRTVAEVQVGEFVWYDPFPFGGKRGWATVTARRDDALNAGHVVFELSRRGQVLCNHYGMIGTSNVRSVRDQAQIDASKAQALAYQATLTKLGKPSRKKA